MSNPRGAQQGKKSGGRGFTPRREGPAGMSGGSLGRGRGGGGGVSSDFQGRGRGRGQPRGGHGHGPGPGGPVIFGGPGQIDERLTKGDENRLIQAFGSLELGDPSRPLRPDYGTAGTAVTLRANFHAVHVPKNCTIYDYKVEITPKARAEDKARIYELLEENPEYKPYAKHIAHDTSERLVSAKELPQPFNIPIPFYDEDDSPSRQGNKVYTVVITFARELDMNEITQYTEGGVKYKDYNPLPPLSALNAIVQKHASRTGVRVGKNRYFFPTSSQGHQLSIGIVAFQGFYASVRPTFKQLMVNVNACMTAFVEPGNLGRALFAFGNRSRGALPTLPENFMKAIKITTRYLGYKRRHSLKAVCTTSARTTKFKHGTYGTISVEQYFKKEFDIDLEYPTELPVVDVSSKQKTQPTYIPAELCEIERTPYLGLLDDKQTSQMIRYACNPPAVNARAIVGEGFNKLGLTSSSESHLDAFGISISNEMAVIPARELSPPSLTYRVGKPTVANGSWNITQVKFHRGARVSRWWVLVVNDGDRGLVEGCQDGRVINLVTAFSDKLKKSGVIMPDGMPSLYDTPTLKPLDKKVDPRRVRALRAIRETLEGALNDSRGQKPDFVLVLLSHRDNFIYPGIKRIGDVELGIHTIHMQLSKVIGSPQYPIPPNKQDQYMSNVALKVNTKLGGINHKLDDNAMAWLKKQSTMMVGIDVTHRGPHSREGTPSIAAVVASIDDDFVQFPASIRIQQTDEIKEMLGELKPMMIERLEAYEERNRKLPERVFVFRDGVSEGQYDTVLQEELPQILGAFEAFNTKKRKTPYRPLLSIIICGKRHHARFFPTDSKFADKNGNTRPGTVVDRGVTGVFDFDFYLQAHAGIQGTVKPTHYTVIYDETGFKANEIQEGTNNVSYLYARATRAVSLMPPAYYADLACERGRCYLNDFLVDDRDDEDDGKSSTTGGKGKGKGKERERESGSGRRDKKEQAKRVFEAAKKAWGNGLHPNMRGSMFYI